MANESFYFNVPSQTLDSVGLYNNFAQQLTVNATFVNGGGGTAVLSLIDINGVERNYNIVSGAPAIVKKAPMKSYKITGNGVVIAGVFSWPDEVDPSSITVAGTIKTDIGQRTDTLTGTNPVSPPAPLETDIGSANTYLKDAKIPQALLYDGSGNLKINSYARNWSLSSSDAPGDTNFTRSPSASQLPSALVGGQLNTRYLTSTDVIGQSPFTLQTDNVGIAKASQLPSALDGSGNFKIRQLSTSDTPTIYGNGGVVKSDVNGNLYHVLTGSSGDAAASSSQSYADASTAEQYLVSPSTGRKWSIDGFQAILKLSLTTVNNSATVDFAVYLQPKTDPTGANSWLSWSTSLAITSGATGTYYLVVGVDTMPSAQQQHYNSNAQTFYDISSPINLSGDWEFELNYSGSGIAGFIGSIEFVFVPRGLDTPL